MDERTIERRNLERRNRRRARRRRQRAMAGLLLLLLLLAAGAIGFFAWRNLQNKENGKGHIQTEAIDTGMSENPTEAQTETQTETESETEPPVVLNLSEEDLYSQYGILIRQKTGEILLDKNSQERFYPASMTKIMTAVVVLENIENLETRITLSAEMFDQLYLEGASMAGFSPGEEVSVLDLLYGVLLPSGAECCTGLAEYVAGSESGFADKMNQKAVELGMENTHFVNASGLHDAEHYTTAADMAKLLAYALENSTFEEIASSAVYSTRPTVHHPEGITVYSTLFGYMTEEIRSGNLILGGKTGYTQEAGLCLASFGEVNGERYLLITAGAEGNHETEPFHILDAYEVYKNIDNK